MGWRIKGHISTPDDPGKSPVMCWLRDALTFSGDECLNWPFSHDGRGYGAYRRGRKNFKVHRVICELVHGAPPTQKHHAAHSCGNGHLGCANPRHLSWKTPQENYKESRPHPKFKLTPEQVKEIRKLKGVERSDKIAVRYGVTERTIRKIHNGTTWKTDDYAKSGFSVKPFNKWAHRKTTDV